MSRLLSKVVTSPKMLPPRIVIHGAGGVGKTTFGASSKCPVFIPFEDGLGLLDVPALPKPGDYSETIAMIEELLKSDHPYRSVVIDTIDHLEPMVWSEVCRRQSEGRKVYENIESLGYGKGYIFADPLWTDFFRGLDALRREKRITVIVLCHNETKTVDDPQIGPYDRVTPKLHKRANALLHEWADIVGYLALERSALEKEGARGRTVMTSQATGRHILYLEDRGGFAAKNRYSLPSQIQIPEVEPFAALRNEIAKRLAPAKES